MRLFSRPISVEAGTGWRETVGRHFILSQMPGEKIKRVSGTVDTERSVKSLKMDNSFAKALEATIACQEIKQEESEEKV